MVQNEIIKIIEKSESIALFSHTRPDADTIGAALALCYVLKRKGKKTQIFCDTQLEPRLSFLKGNDEIEKEFYGKYDAHIALDCGDAYRLGLLMDSFFKGNITVNIDHHNLTNDKYAQINWVDTRASSSEMVYELIEMMNVDIDVDIAQAVMSGIITDTNSFSNTNTDEKVLATAGKLIKYVNINALNFTLRRNTSYGRMRLMGQAMSRARNYFDGKVILMYVLNQDLIDNNVTLSATEGFVEQALNVDSAKAAVCICQASESGYKVSMRGKDGTDVCAVCQSFGGGGHKVAAGCNVNGFFEDVVDKILKAFADELNYERIY
ncbi:MAG: bifunctional oligoribonuclease/PAP phosphatase NrnA [Clostridia bacterium]